MYKIKQFAVAFAVALWFTSDVFGHENKQSSNLEESDFYFNDISLNESAQDSNPLKTETTEFNKNGEHESIDKSHSEDDDEYFSVGNLKRLIRYFVSLLHSINKNNSHDAEFLQDYKFRKKSLSRKNKVKANRTSSTPRIYKSSYSENTRDTEFEHSGEEKDSEYNEAGKYFKNAYEETSRIKTLKSNNNGKPRAQNHGSISGGQQKNSDDKQKLTSKDFRFNRHRANHSASRNGHVSDEFIDEYINPPTEKVFMKSYEEPVTNQPIISSERENQTVFKENPREENVSKAENRTLINPQSLKANNITTDMKTTFNKEVEKKEFFINDGKESNDTNHKAFSNQTRDMKNKNTTEISAVENTQNHFRSNKSPHFIRKIPQNNKNGTSTSLSEEHASVIPNKNSSSPGKNELSRSQKQKISSVRKDAYDKTQKNLSVLDDSRNIKFLKENIKSAEPQIELESISFKAENESSRQLLNNTKSFEMLQDFNKTNRLRTQNSSTDRESKTDTGEPNERHFVKHSKLEEKETREFSYESEGLKSWTDSNPNTNSSDSNSDNWTKMQSESVSNKAERGSSQQSLNSTKTLTIPRDFSGKNRFLLHNSSADTESETDTDESNEQHFVEHPKLEEKKAKELSIAYKESKKQTDSDMDSDYSDYSDSEELDEYYEYEDRWTQMQSGSASYKAKNMSSEQPLNSAQNFTMPVESKKANLLLLQNSSTNAESKNDAYIPSEQYSVQHPKLEEQESWELPNASQESKVQIGSDMDSDSSDYSDSEELDQYYEYDDEDIKLVSDVASYFTGNSSNASTTTSEKFTTPFSNHSMEIEVPTSSGSDSKINTPHKTQGLYNSIIEFLYKYSNNTWIKKLKEENRRM